MFEIMEKKAITKDLLLDYGTHLEEALPRVKERIKELERMDEDYARRLWTVMERWQQVRHDLPIYYGVAPDGLPGDDTLCFVVLGYQLEKDGSMKGELLGRLEVALESAKKYPNAYVLCSGGGTAAENEKVTEAGQMAAWLLERGVEEGRIIVENRSRTTGQNAICSYDLLTERYPSVQKIAVVTSDYHVLGGTLLLGAEAIFKAGALKEERLQVIANAAWKAPTTDYPPTYQAYALIEICADFCRKREEG